MAWAIAASQLPDDTVAYSIELVAKKYGLCEKAITNPRCKGRRIMLARREIVARHRDLSDAQISLNTGLARTTIHELRKTAVPRSDTSDIRHI